MTDDRAENCPGGQQQSPTSNNNNTPNRKRKMTSIPSNATFVWAREGDHDGAKDHPAYLLSSTPSPPSNDKIDCNTKDNGEGVEYVWVQWASNGTISKIPKCNISSDLPSVVLSLMTVS